MTMVSGISAGCAQTSESKEETVSQESVMSEEENQIGTAGAETENASAENNAAAEGAESAGTENRPLTLEQAVSAAILNEKMYSGEECRAEGHIILETEENEKTTVVYALTMYGEYQFQNKDYFVKSAGSGVIPAVLTYETKTDGSYVLQSFRWPEDGSGYVQSIQEMFPEELWENCISIAEEDREELEAQEQAYAAAYLEMLGREAEIGDYGDFPHTLLTEEGVSVEASNRLLEYSREVGEYPMWIGSLEKVEDGVRYIYEQILEKENQRILYRKTEYGTGTVAESFEFDMETGEMLSAYKESKAAAVSAAQPGMTGNGQLVNPIQPSSPEEFAEMGITLELPANETWVQNKTYTMISGETAQIQYYDGIADADVTLRAGTGDVMEQAGIYYAFDDSREEQWSSTHNIRLQYAVADGKEIGVLASWTKGELTYTMWGQFCREGEHDASSIAKAAVYVAEHAGE